MNLSEKDMTSYESIKIKMLIAFSVYVFDMMSDSMYGDYEVCGTDKDGRDISIKVTIDKEGDTK